MLAAFIFTQLIGIKSLSITAPEPLPAYAALNHWASGQAAPVRVWVFFNDKGLQLGLETDAALRNLEHTYNVRAVQRRTLRRSLPGLFDERDLPVCQAYIDAVTNVGATPRVVSSWLNALSAEVTPAQLEKLETLACVRSIEPVRQGRRLSEIPAVGLTPAGATAPRDLYGYSGPQLAQITVTNLHTAGYTGAGVIVGILDTGFIRTHTAFNQPGHVVHIIAEHDFVKGDNNTAPEAGDDPDQATHGTLILGCLGAYLPGTLVGGAYDAAFVLAKTEDITQEVPAEEDNYVAGLQFIEANGGDMTTSSLGYIDWYTQADLNGVTAVTTVAVNAATDNGVICCTAAGNSGNDGDPATSHLIAPADAFRVFTVGAVDVNGTLTSFSSDGPSADGRIKPEVLACGYHTYTVYPYDNTSIAYASGTSLSTPLAAAAVACILQNHPTWSVAQMRKALTMTASVQVATGTFDPLFAKGYGIINAYNAAQQPSCMGDLNGDGHIDLSDLALQLANFGKHGAVTYKQGDVDVDGDIDLSDVAILLSAYGQGC